jgi:hypothetical protein
MQRRGEAAGQSPARPGKPAAQGAAKGAWGPLAPTWNRRKGPQKMRLQRRKALRRARIERAHQLRHLDTNSRAVYQWIRA